MLAAGIPVTVAIGNVEVASREAGGSIAAFSSRGLVLDGTLKPDLAAPGVSVPTSEPGRGDDGEVRFGTISGTSAAAAVTAGVAAVLAQGRPSLGARSLHGLLVGSAQRADLDPTASGAGLVDLRAAVQQELLAEPALLSFGAVCGAVRRRAQDPRHERLDAPPLGHGRKHRDRAEGCGDHHRSAALPPAAGSNGDRGRSGRHGGALRGGGRGHG